MAATVQGFVRRFGSFFRSSGCRSGQCLEIDATDLRGSLQLWDFSAWVHKVPQVPQVVFIDFYSLCLPSWRAVGIMHHKLVTLLPIWTVCFSWHHTS